MCVVQLAFFSYRMVLVDMIPFCLKGFRDLKVISILKIDLLLIYNSTDLCSLPHILR